MIHFTNASVTIEGLSPYSQSRQHDDPFLEGESRDDYDLRTWRSKLNVGANGNIIIPAHGIHQAIAAAARYSGKQIPGQGKKTWTAKFTTGISIFEDADTGVTPDAAQMVTISANADGVRGSGKRVLRRFPFLPHGWTATFDVVILDPIITEAIFTEMLTLSGMFIGLGRFRPEKGGVNGRFRIADLKWQDQRKLVA